MRNKSVNRVSRRDIEIALGSVSRTCHTDRSEDCVSQVDNPPESENCC